MGALEEEEPAGAHWVAVEAEEAVGDPAEEQRGLSSADQEFHLVYSMIELQHRCPKDLILPDTTMSQKAHPCVHRHTRWHCYRGLTQTGAVSGAASVAAASAGGVAPAG